MKEYVITPAAAQQVKAPGLTGKTLAPKKRHGALRCDGDKGKESK